MGERPGAPWHPLPLSELLILVGGVVVVITILYTHHGGAPVIAGVGAVLIGTLEVTSREHRTGFRSHAVILSLLTVIVFHTVLVLILSPFITVTRVLNIGLLAIDVALFAFLVRLLRARFLEARRRRAFGGR